ncbi:MAG: AzlC family ABC transporter permease [Paracoccaceae bacterium]
MPLHDVCLTRAGILRGARQLAPLSLFVIPFGLAYGVAAVEAGMSAAQAITASALTFSGAAQFTALDLWGPDISLIALVLVTLAVSARHVIMGAALSPWVNQLGSQQRVLSAVFLSDPNFAHTHYALKQGQRDVGVLIGSGAIGWAAWVIGTAIGAIGGNQLGDPAAYGIDVLMPVYFAALVLPRVQARSQWAFAGVAALVAVVLDPVLPSGWNVILAAIAGGLVGVRAANG